MASKNVNVPTNIATATTLLVSCHHVFTTEASYAYNQKKTIIPLLLEADYKPEGWIDDLIGTKLNYNLFSDKEIKKNMSEVKKAISRHCKSQGGISEIDGGPVKTSDTRSWSNEQALEWFDEIKLPTLKVMLDFCDGGGLKDMYDRSCRDMDGFKEDCKSSFKLNDREFSRFIAGLKEIF